MEMSQEMRNKNFANQNDLGWQMDQQTNNSPFS